MPFIIILPLSGVYSFNIRLTIVVFPLPFSPTNAFFSLAFITNEQSSSTTFSLLGYLKVTFLNSIVYILSIIIEPVSSFSRLISVNENTSPIC